jgi:cation transport regulator ChaC
LNNIGILAYGSLICNPGKEIQALITDFIEGVKTPFKVEFLRSSKSRDGAPTLVPVEEGSDFGDYVEAKIFVLKEDTSVKKATDILYRREMHKVGSSKEYRQPLKPGPNNIFICKYKYSLNLNVVLYTKITGNIDNPTPRTLALLAIKSACSKAGKSRRDGISYLIDAKRNGIKTPLMPDYEKEVLRQTNSKNLQEAWEVLTK